jgi:hypothetical protein
MHNAPLSSRSSKFKQCLLFADEAFLDIPTFSTCQWHIAGNTGLAAGLCEFRPHPKQLRWLVQYDHSEVSSWSCKLTGLTDNEQHSPKVLILEK